MRIILEDFQLVVLLGSSKLFYIGPCLGPDDDYKYRLRITYLDFFGFCKTTVPNKCQLIHQTLLEKQTRIVRLDLLQIATLEVCPYSCSQCTLIDEMSRLNHGYNS